MRKPQRLSKEQLAPWVWELPKAGWRRQPPDASQEVLVASDNQGACVPPRPIDWPTFFGNANPVEIEVGTGKGLFLLNAATARPDTNFLGIEVVRKYQLYAATRYAIRNLPNVKTACADAAVVLRDYVAPGSVAAVHVYFPDPWWKKRHHKRRVIASDVEEYFGLMTAILRAMPAFAERPEEADRAAPPTEAGYATNFERKALAGGGSVWRAVYERTPEAVTVVADPAE